MLLPAGPDRKREDRRPAGGPAGRRVTRRPLTVVRTRERAPRHLGRGVDLRVARVRRRPLVGLVPGEAVHLLGVGVVGGGPVAAGVLLGQPGLPERGGGLLAGG